MASPTTQTKRVRRNKRRKLDTIRSRKNRQALKKLKTQGLLLAD